VEPRGACFGDTCIDIISFYFVSYDTRWIPSSLGFTRNKMKRRCEGGISKS
jgi:hypothetical protein